MLHFSSSFDKVQQKFGKIFGAYKNIPSSANILKDFCWRKKIVFICSWWSKINLKGS